MSESAVRTFLFTDLVGSTAQWEADPAAMSAALVRHDRATAAAVAEAGGVVFKHVGDGVCAVFESPSDAVRAAVALQRLLADEPLLALRMGVHTGRAEHRGGDWFGPTLNRCARLMAVAHGRQVLVSAAAAGMVAADPPPDVALVPMGTVRLRGIDEPEDAHQVVADGLARDFPPLSGQAVDTLPRPRTSFVGREDEVADALSRLETTKVLTLAGVGGTGKTRLAVEVAGRARPAFPDGVMFAALADVGDAEGVELAVAQAAQVGGVPGAGPAAGVRAAVLRALTGRRALLVVDNCEHLLDAIAGLVDELVERCPELRVLATSREPLDVAGERVMRVPAMRDEAALALLVERARVHDEAFELSASERPVALDLCRRLDGLPLAIELAAARCRALTVADVAARLDDRFRLLAGRGRTHDRHATLRAALDWSFDLLDDDERRLLARLSVFSGGFALAAVEEVCGQPPLGADATVDLLVSLVDKSLVVTGERDGRARYAMLETVRAYAADRLLDGGESEAMVDRHARWVERLALDYWVALARGDDPVELLDELENARAGLLHAMARGWSDASLWIASAMTSSWLRQGRRVGRGEVAGPAWSAAEGHRRCLQALALDGGDPSARLLCTLIAASAAVWTGDVTTAWRLGLDALEQSRTRATVVPELVVWSLLSAAAVGVDTGAGPTFDECVAERRRRSTTESDLGTCEFEVGRQRLHEGRMAEAAACFEAALPLDPSLVLWRHFFLAVTRFHVDGRTALPPGFEDVATQSGDQLLLASVLAFEAVHELRRGGSVDGVVAEIIHIARTNGIVLSYLGDALASIAIEAGAPELAALLIGTVAFARVPLAPRLDDRTREAVGAERFASLVAEGGAMDDDAIAEVARRLPTLAPS